MRTSCISSPAVLFHLRSLVLFLLLLAGLLVRPGLAEAQPRVTHVVEAEMLLAFGEGQGRAPLFTPGGSLELRLARSFGLSLSAHALVLSPRTFQFLDEGNVGGGASASVRLYPRGGWPQGFALGGSAGLRVVEGVAVLDPKLELIYRWLVSGGITLRIVGHIGGLFVWDTATEDGRAGPEGDGISAILVGLGVAAGWQGGLSR